MLIHLIRYPCMDAERDKDVLRFKNIGEVKYLAYQVGKMRLVSMYRDDNVDI